MPGQQSNQRLALMGLAVNVALAGVKIGAGVLGNAYALVADGVESLLDVGSSLIIWSGLRFASRPPDSEYPYGYGKAEPIAGAIVAFIILIAALGLAVESVRELATPSHTPKAFTLVVLIGVVIIKEYLFRRVSDRSVEVGSTALATDAWHHRFDAITSVAAFIGVSISIIGGPGYERADKFAALVACGIIGVNGFRLLVPALREIMDTAPPEELRQAIRISASTVEGVKTIDKCYVRKMGVEFYVDIHVLVDGDLSVREGHRIAHAVKDQLRTDFPAIRDALVHIEPM